MTDAAPPTPPAPPQAAPSGPDAEEGLSRQTIVTITAIGGGLLALSLLLSSVVQTGGPMVAIVAAAFGGAVTLLVGAILGATSRKFESGARVGFGIGAAAAALLLLFVVIIGPAAATGSAPVCGVAAAGPGLFALRAFSTLRDVGF